MTTIPTRVAGDTGVLSDHNAIAGILNDPATNWTQGNATYVPGIVIAPGSGAGGADDAALLQAAMTGTKDVYLSPGAVYTVTTFSAWPAYTGTIHGNGATIRFRYTGAYQSTALIGTWADVKLDHVIIDGKNLQCHAIWGPGCSRLRFVDCTFIDVTPNVADPIDSTLVCVRCRWTQSGAPPTTIQQTVCCPNAGRFIVQDCDVQFAPVGASGSVVSCVATIPTAGQTVHVLNNRVWTDDLTGYTYDSFFDCEPQGSVPFDLVEFAGNTTYNCTNYLSGATRINAHHNKNRFTSNNGGALAFTPYTIFNANGSQPATGIVAIEDNDVLSDAVVSAHDSHFWRCSIAVSQIWSRRNKVTLNGSAADGGKSIYDLAVGSQIDTLWSEDDDIGYTSSPQNSDYHFLNESNAPTRVKFHRTKFRGQTSHAIALGGGAETVALVEVKDCDFTDYTSPNGANNQNAITLGSKTVTSFVARGNAGMNPVGASLPAAAPAVPASTVNVTNTTGCDCMVTITGGTVTVIKVGGTTTGLTSGAFRLPAGQTISVTYSVAPTWVWLGD